MKRRHGLVIALRLLPALLLALVLATLSVQIERLGPEMVVRGNLCGPEFFDVCLEPELMGGFPFPFLYDSPATSVQHQLAFVEDDFQLFPWVVDVLFYFLIVVGVSRGAVFGWRRLRTE